MQKSDDQRGSTSSVPAQVGGSSGSGIQPDSEMSVNDPEIVEDMDDDDDQESDRKKARIVAALEANAEKDDDQASDWECPWMDDNQPLTSEEKQQALYKELGNLIERGTFTRVKKADVKNHEEVINTTVVYKRKNGEARARICVQNFRTPGAQDPELFAPTPSVTSLRIVLYHAAKHTARDGNGHALFLGDVSAAFLNAEIDKPTKARPPRDLGEEAKEFTWDLKKALYGLRRSPKLWTDFLRNILSKHGWRNLKSDPGLYKHHKLNAILLVHVDDIVISCDANYGKEFLAKLSAEIELKHVKLNREHDQGEFLGKKLTRLKDGYTLAGDWEIIMASIKELNLENGKGVDTPAVVEKDTVDETLLTEEQKSEFARHVGRLIYVAMDRCDMQYAVKQMARKLSAPNMADWTAMKRILRYALKKGPQCYEFDGKQQVDKLTVECDSDWGSCRATRKSTSGGLVLVGRNMVISSWGRTQATVALSSREAELGAIVTAACEAIGCQNTFEELGMGQLDVVISTDSKAAYDGLKKNGPGKMKHVQLKWWYLQDAIRHKMIYMKKIPGEENRSDILTKATNKTILDRHGGKLNLKNVMTIATLLVTAMAQEDQPQKEDRPQGQITVFKAAMGLATIGLICVMWMGYLMGWKIVKYFQASRRSWQDQWTQTGDLKEETWMDENKEKALEDQKSITLAKNVLIFTQSGERYHVNENCRGLREAKHLWRRTPCRFCVGVQ